MVSSSESEKGKETGLLVLEDEAKRAARGRRIRGRRPPHKKRR